MVTPNDEIAIIVGKLVVADEKFADVLLSTVKNTEGLLSYEVDRLESWVEILKIMKSYFETSDS